MIVTLFQLLLVMATLLCSLVAGFLFAFAVVVMPGIRSLDDGAFIRAFQVIDRVIQNAQPLFIFVWIGSIIATIGVAFLGVWVLTGFDRFVLVLAALLYLLGVQLPTIRFNIPLNNHLQRLDVAALGESMRQDARRAFEPNWNRWNVRRTACATLVSTLLLLVLLRL